MSYIKKKSQRQEKRTAKEFNGKTTPASGALSGAKGDVRTGKREGTGFNQSDYLIENKFTDKDYYPLKLSTWEKIEKEALRDNLRTPLMQIDIQNLSIVIIDCYDIDTTSLKNVAFLSTNKKSIKLSLEMLMTNLMFVDCISLNFIKYKVDKHLIIMEKGKFLDMMEED